MDMERYEELVRNWVPTDEEERTDQQRYIRASMELRQLNTREKLADDVYERMHRAISANGDNEQVENFEIRHVSESEYDREYQRIADIVEEIDKKYNIGQEQINSEIDNEASVRREDLRALQVYYENAGTYIMRNVNVDELSRTEVIEMYDSMRNGSNPASFDEMVAKGKEIVRERRLALVRERVARFGQPTQDPIQTTRSDTGNTGNDNQDNEKENVEKQIEKYNSDVERIKKHLVEINGRLVLGDTDGLDLNEVVRGLDSEVNELAETAKGLITEIDNFKLKWENVDLTTNYNEIMSELQEIKDNLRKLKREQVKQYNIRVDATTAVINELRALNNPEIDARLAELPELQRCSANITSWNASLKYLDQVNYDRLIEVNKSLVAIKNLNNLGTNPGESSNNGDRNDDENDLSDQMKDTYRWGMLMQELHEEVSRVEDEIERIESEISEGMTLDDINRLRENINVCSDSLNVFRAKLDNNRDKLDQEDYDKFVERYMDATEMLMDLNTVLNQKGMDKAEVSVDKNKIYNELMRRASLLRGSLNNLNLLSNSLFGKANESTVKVYGETLNDTYMLELVDLENEIEEKYKTGKLDDNQYNNLKKEVEELKHVITQLNEILRNPEMIKDADIFEVLNGEIDGLENALDKLEEQVEKLNEPIKKDDRKNIDNIINHLLREVKRLENLAEDYKEKDPDKYNATMDRLNNVKDRLDKVGKNYRKKCPLLVRAVKEAKNFFKQHKKIILIAAGLAALALVSYHVLIPAIMHGNIMIAGTTPALRPFMKFSNNVLGGIIGATKDSMGIWSLANGVIINPSCAASSLLKGLAVSGISTATMVAPLVVGVKHLIDKMKTSELKKRLGEEKDKFKEKQDKNKENRKKKKDENINVKNNKKADKDAIANIAELLKEYRKSGKTIEEFALEKGLNEEEVAFLMYLDKKSQENKNLYEEGNSRGGRK